VDGPPPAAFDARRTNFLAMLQAIAGSRKFAEHWSIQRNASVSFS